MRPRHISKHSATALDDNDAGQQQHNSSRLSPRQMEADLCVLRVLRSYFRQPG
ncbi:uncharacterized protein V6R79_008394 [Siganus canaliculatus]